MLRRGLNGNQLKLIAVVVMLIDHIGYMIGQKLFPQLYYGTEQYQFWLFVYNMLRSIGRVAFPIFCFLIVEGYIHTSNRKKYAARLFTFALISEVPFDYMSSGTWLSLEHQNVFWTLLLGVLMMAAIDAVGHRIIGSEGVGLQIVVIAVFCMIATGIRCDYDYIGIMVIAIFFWFRNQRIWQCLAGYGCMIWSVQRWEYRFALLVPFILLWFYNGERGRKIRSLQWFFYWFYPLHMLIITIAGTMILG